MSEELKRIKDNIREGIKNKQRFFVQPISYNNGRYNETIVYDILNTEPVCVIYSLYHSYAVEVIKQALDKYEEENKTMEKHLQFLEESES